MASLQRRACGLARASATEQVVRTGASPAAPCRRRPGARGGEPGFHPARLRRPWPGARGPGYRGPASPSPTRTRIGPDADAAAALASHAPADAAAPAVASSATTPAQAPFDVAPVKSVLLAAEAEPRSPRSPRTPKDACVVCWERRREVACYPCMCVAASRRFPLILHLTPRLRGDTPSPRRRLNV